VILYYIIGPIGMITFGLLTIRNIRNQTLRVAPMVSQNRHRRTESQLSRVLLIQVGTHLFFSIPAAVVYVITTFIPSANTPFFSGLRLISVLWQQPIFFLSFFSYILSSTLFRTELLKMFKLNNRNNRIVQNFTLVRKRLLTRSMMDTRV
jgi:membrane-anchored glycerophosphoryl diester phosphodiesterase (GDPDase)